MEILNNALSVIFSLQTILFCLGVYLPVLIARRVLEAIFRAVSKRLPAKLTKYNDWLSHLWLDWVLPAAPVVLGGLLAAFVKQYPYPEAIVDSGLARVFFGLVAGFASAYVYRGFKAFLSKILPQKTTEQLSSVAGSNPPDPGKLVD